MTNEFDVQSAEQVCDACGHAPLSHDAIATRYCQASRDRGLDRACVCPVGSVTAETEKEHGANAVRKSEAPMYGRGRFSRT
jgi:hypothetical protein